MDRVRIQKILAEAGVASRRAAEVLIVEGRVTVNGHLVEALPCFVGPDDDVRVDGQRVRRRAPQKVYFLLNKPRGVVCTQRDPAGRPRATDLIPPIPQRVYCVGRLDADGTGLIVLTNDGDLTEYLTHPRHGVEKTYEVEVDGCPAEGVLSRLRAGRVRLLRRGQQRSVLEVRLAESRGRDVRGLLAGLGHKVRRLRRVAIGPVTDRGLKVGNFRALTPGEVARLRGCGRVSLRRGGHDLEKGEPR